jgi:hypothetical protein
MASRASAPIAIRCDHCARHPILGLAEPDDSVASGWVIRVAYRTGRPDATYKARTMATFTADVNARARRFRCPSCKREITCALKTLYPQVASAATVGATEIRIR